MSAKSEAHEILKRMAGNWQGETSTWFEPGILADQSPMKATARTILGDRFLQLEYEGQIEGKEFGGIYTCGYDIPNKTMQVSWVDSFHMGTGIVFLTGSPSDQGFNIKGSYTSPQMPEPWGWRIEFMLVGDDELKIASYNISPEGQEDIATETIFRRSL